MRERTGLEREARLLELRGDPPALGAAPDRLLSLDWVAVGRRERALLSTSDQDETTPIEVEALRFQGRRNEIALVFAGVHGDEPQGVDVANRIVDQLTAAVAKPLFTTIVIKELIGDKRRPPDNWTAKDDPQAKRKRWVLIGSKVIEPNRNFPRPGVEYEKAAKTGNDEKRQPELFGENKKALTRNRKEDHKDRSTNRMTAETRILIQLIEKVRPVRAASLHAHLLPGTRGDGPGVFVDPRGGFDAANDYAKTAAGRGDDEFTFGLLYAALTAVSKLDAANPLRKLRAVNPFLGNLADSAGRVAPAPGTVHYTSKKHSRGTSFGMWAPADATSGGRKGMLTVTVEIPRYPEAQRPAQGEINQIYADLLTRQFLGLR